MSRNTSVQILATTCLLLFLFPGQQRASAQVFGPPRTYYSYWDLMDNRSYNALPDLIGQVNLATIAEQEPGGPNEPAYATLNADQLQTTITYDLQALQLARSHSIPAWVSVEYVFWAPGCQLYSNWESRWATFVAGIQAYSSDVLAFYVFDEAYESALLNHVPYDTIESELSEVCEAIRAKFPTVMLANGCQAYSIINNLNLSMFDWVGFDDYGASATTLNAYLTDLETQLHIPFSGKRTFIIPYAYSTTLPANPTSAQDPIVKALSAQQPIYEQLAEDHSSIIAVISFLYNSQSGLVGLDKMPTVQAIYKAWYARLENGQR